MGTELLYGRYGLALNYASTATVQGPPETCTPEILGCMDLTALNYDPYATKDFKCYAKVAGCLNPKAMNFNCTSAGESACTESVTVHSAGACQFYVPTIVLPEDAYGSPVVSMTTEGSVDDVTEAMKLDLATAVTAEITGVTPSADMVSVAQGSIVWTV